MARITLSSIASAFSSLTSLNSNFQKLSDALDKTLFRDGTGDNQMLSHLNLNQFKIQNSGKATNITDVPNLGQVLEAVATIPKGDKGESGAPGANVMSIGLFSDTPLLSIPVGADLVQTSGWNTKGIGYARYIYDPAINAAYVAANPRTSFISSNGRGFKLAEPSADITQFGAKVNGRRVDDAVVTAGSTTLTSSTAGFTTSDVGKWALVWIFTGDYSSGLLFAKQITAYISPTQVTLSAAPTASRSKAVCIFGTDDSSAVIDANTYLKNRGGGQLFFPKGITVYAGNSPELQPWSDVDYCGEGRSSWLVAQGNAFRTNGVSVQEFLTNNFYPIANVVAGDRGFYCSTPSHAANFPVGRLAYIRSTSFVDYGSGNQLPRFNEMSQVISNDPTTGYVELADPIKDSWSSLTAALMPETVPQRMRIHDMSVRAGYSFFFGQGHYRSHIYNLFIESYHGFAVNAHNRSVIENIDGNVWWTGVDGGRALELKVGSVSGVARNFNISVQNVNSTNNAMTGPNIDIGEFARDIEISNVVFNAADSRCFQVVADFRALRSRITNIKAVVKSSIAIIAATCNFSTAETSAPIDNLIEGVDIKVLDSATTGLAVGSSDTLTAKGMTAKRIRIRGNLTNSLLLFGSTDTFTLDDFEASGTISVNGTHVNSRIPTPIKTDNLSSGAYQLNLRNSQRSNNNTLVREKHLTNVATSEIVSQTSFFNYSIPANSYLRPGDRFTIEAEGFGSPDAVLKKLSAQFDTLNTGDLTLPASVGSSVVPFRIKVTLTMVGASTFVTEGVTNYSLLVTLSSEGQSYARIINGSWDNTVPHSFGISAWMASSSGSEYIRFIYAKAIRQYLEDA